MKKARITKRFQFEAAHCLTKHDGKCKQVHGHTYTLEVSLIGDIIENPFSPEFGMVFDFGKLGKVVRSVIDMLYDHRMLNDSLEGVYPTAENMCYELFSSISMGLTEATQDGPNRIMLEKVRLWETANSWAEVSCDMITGILGGEF